MKKECALLLVVVLLSAPGCGGGQRKKTRVVSDKKTTQVYSAVDIPVAGNEYKSLFDEDISEFVPRQEDQIAQSRPEAGAIPDSEATQEFAWVEEAGRNSTDFRVVYFDFDSNSLRADQESPVGYNINHLRDLYLNAERDGRTHDFTIIVEGHSCHSAGSKVYNLALSEQRAKSLCDRLVAAGIPRKCIKIVGRGQEVPAIKEGKMVTGNRQEQWPNRRTEIRILQA